MQILGAELLIEFIVPHISFINLGSLLLVSNLGRTGQVYGITKVEPAIFNKSLQIIS